MHREAWFLGGPRIPKNPIFLKNGKNHPKRKNSKTSRDMPKLAIHPLTRGLYSIGKRGFHHILQGKISKKNFFLTIFKQKCFNLRPLLPISFPQGFWISKNIGHPTSGSGGKKTFKQYLKSEHTDKHTDTQTDISTYRKHRPRGSMLWNFESKNKSIGTKQIETL